MCALTLIPIILEYFCADTSSTSSLFVGAFSFTTNNAFAGDCPDSRTCPLRHDYSPEERQQLFEYFVFTKERQQRAVTAMAATAPGRPAQEPCHGVQEPHIQDVRMPHLAEVPPCTYKQMRAEDEIEVEEI